MPQPRSTSATATATQISQPRRVAPRARSPGRGAATGTRERSQPHRHSSTEVGTRRLQLGHSHVAGMLRSLSYAAHAVAFRRPEPERTAALVALTAWEAQARDAFLTGYLGQVAESPVPLVPATAEALRSAVAPFELQKAAYELRYELDNRPDWVAIPLAGIRRILERSPTGA